MKIGSKFTQFEISHRKASALLFALVVAGSFSAVSAQHRLSKRYPVNRNVQIVLKNMFGTITVESWDRDEVKLTATFDSPKANISPRQSAEQLVVDVIGDNQGRMDVGDVNFKLQVPVNSSVDLQTKRGQITVNNLRGSWLRAVVSLEGDIQLTGITSAEVYAHNRTGDIYFDGEFARGGNYQFQSNKGEITIRIPADSAFNLTASSQNNKISLGPFWSDRFQNLGNGRKYVGDVGDGKSKVSVTNFQGSIQFIRR